MNKNNNMVNISLNELEELKKILSKLNINVPINLENMNNKILNDEESNINNAKYNGSSDNNKIHEYYSDIEDTLEPISFNSDTCYESDDSTNNDTENIIVNETNSEFKDLNVDETNDSNIIYDNQIDTLIINNSNDNEKLIEKEFLVEFDLSSDNDLNDNNNLNKKNYMNKNLNNNNSDMKYYDGKNIDTNLDENDLDDTDLEDELIPSDLKNNVINQSEYNILEKKEINENLKNLLVFQIINV